MNFNRKGFTLIELLIVIVILGILAVSLLAAINPIEQIRRASDQRIKNDVSQLYSAIQRYRVSRDGHTPWAGGTDGTDNAINNQAIDEDIETLNGAATPFWDALQGSGRELNENFSARDTWNADSDQPVLLTSNETADIMYMCFSPKSQVFQDEADEDAVERNETDPLGSISSGGGPGVLAGCSPGETPMSDGACMVCIPE